MTASEPKAATKALENALIALKAMADNGSQASVPAPTGGSKLETKEIVSLYTALRVFESDCDKAQGTLRTIASAWMIAAISGIGLIIQNEYTKSPGLDPAAAAVLRQGVIFAASLGMVPLWYIDQRVYQRLLHGSFAAGCWMERVFENSLPPIRTYIFSLNSDITSYLGWFYKGPILVFATAAVVNCGVALVLETGRAGTAVLMGAHLLTVVYVLHRAGSWPSLAAAMPPIKSANSAAGGKTV